MYVFLLGNNSKNGFFQPESMPTDWLEDPPAMFKDFNCHQGRKDLIDIICNHAWNSEVGNVLRKECYDVLSGKR